MVLSLGRVHLRLAFGDLGFEARIGLRLSRKDGSLGAHFGLATSLFKALMHDGTT